MIGTPLRDCPAGVAPSDRTWNRQYWDVEGRGNGTKPLDHTEAGVYEHGPDSEAANLWDLQTEKLGGWSPRTPAVALAQQQIKRRAAKRSLAMHERRKRLASAIAGAS